MLDGGSSLAPVPTFWFSLLPTIGVSPTHATSPSVNNPEMPTTVLMRFLPSTRGWRRGQWLITKTKPGARPVTLIRVFEPVPHGGRAIIGSEGAVAIHVFMQRAPRGQAHAQKQEQQRMAIDVDDDGA